MANEFFTGVDAAWLRMDRPGNLAQIAGVMVFDTPVDRARLIDLVHERLLVYDRFRQRVREPLLGLGLPRWELDPHFDLNYHLPQISLPAPGGQLELQRLVGDLMSQPLDRSHPLWRIYYVDNYQDGCALVPVLHHCIADGLALVQVLLAMTDPQPGTTAFQQPVPANRVAVNRWGLAPFRPLTQLIDTTSSIARTATREALLTLSEPARVTQANRPSWPRSADDGKDRATGQPDGQGGTRVMNWLVIMAVGAGERFWPMSRQRRPKQLLPLTAPATMIQ